MKLAPTLWRKDREDVVGRGADYNPALVREVNRAAKRGKDREEKGERGGVESDNALSDACRHFSFLYAPHLLFYAQSKSLPLPPRSLLLQGLIISM